MRLFREHFGPLIGVALLGIWGLFLAVRYSLSGKNESPIAYPARFCEKYEGRPCMQMKAFLGLCYAGAVCASIFIAVIPRF
jgi:hypothetical protein